MYNECPVCALDEEDIFTPNSLDVDWQTHWKPLFIFNKLPYFYAVRQTGFCEGNIFYCNRCHLYYKRRFEINKLCREDCLYYDQSTDFCYPLGWKECKNNEHLTKIRKEVHLVVIE